VRGKGSTDGRRTGHFITIAENRQLFKIRLHATQISLDSVANLVQLLFSDIGFPFFPTAL
jgi:hypothetical protein